MTQVGVIMTQIGVLIRGDLYDTMEIRIVVIFMSLILSFAKNKKLVIYFENYYTLALALFAVKDK